MQLYYSRSKIFHEFTPEEREEFFSMKAKAVRHHVDTLYYSVFLQSDIREIKDDPDINQLLRELQGMKDTKLANMSEPILYHEMTVEAFGAAVGGGLYGFHLSYGQDYDIFVSSYLPNKETPRIQVQLRTRSLVLDGLYGSIRKSYDKVYEILDSFNLRISHCIENRIDYAFHTNVIQNPDEMFSEEALKKHLVTTFRDNFMHNKIHSRQDDLFEKDYCALGQRKSNNVFFRAYEKTKEVVEENYKAFFFEVWYQNGLISFYDKYVYEIAYKLGAYKTGVLVGRIDFYLKYGHNDALKVKLYDLLESCHINSDNVPAIEKAIKGILPPVTKIMNVEFETKRKFYMNQSEFVDIVKTDVKQGEPLSRLLRILSLRREFITRLTTQVVCLREDRKDPESPMLDFWKRLSRVKIDDQPDEARLKAFSTYTHNFDLQRAKHRLYSTLAAVSFAESGDEESDGQSYGTDLWNFVTDLNDNDIIKQDKIEGAKSAITEMSSSWYAALRRRKVRQMKAIYKERPKGYVFASDADFEHLAPPFKLTEEEAEALHREESEFLAEQKEKADRRQARYESEQAKKRLIRSGMLPPEKKEKSVKKTPGGK